MEKILIDSKNLRAVKSFLKKNSLKLVEKISRGYSSEVFLVKNLRGKKFALKVEKSDSPRRHLAQKEAANLLLANSKKIGPKLFRFGENAGVVLMEFVDGIPFSKWLFEKNPSKKVLKKFVAALLLQAKVLDKIGLDHGQLAGKGANILVRKNLPVIIDFEKASQVRKCHNETQLKSFLFENPNGAVAKKVAELLQIPIKKNS